MNERKKERKNEIKKETKKATARTSLELCSRHCVGIFREPGVLGCGIFYYMVPVGVLLLAGISGAGF